jgi:hypothetical protein
VISESTVNSSHSNVVEPIVLVSSHECPSVLFLYSFCTHMHFPFSSRYFQEDGLGKSTEYCSGDPGGTF